MWVSSKKLLKSLGLPELESVGEKNSLVRRPHRLFACKVGSSCGISTQVTGEPELEGRQTFYFLSSPEDVLIDFRERGREVEREGEKH